MACGGSRSSEGDSRSPHVHPFVSSSRECVLPSQAAIDVVAQLEAASRQLRGLHRCQVVEELIPVLSSAAAVVKRVMQQKSEQQEFRQSGVDLQSSGGPLRLTLQLLVEVWRLQQQ